MKKILLGFVLIVNTNIILASNIDKNSSNELSTVSVTMSDLKEVTFALLNDQNASSLKIEELYRIDNNISQRIKNRNLKIDARFQSMDNNISEKFKNVNSKIDNNSKKFNNNYILLKNTIVKVSENSNEIKNIKNEHILYEDFFNKYIEENKKLLLDKED